MSKNWVSTFLREGLNRKFIKSQIPPRREIWLKIALDPTPKKIKGERTRWLTNPD